MKKLTTFIGALCVGCAALTCAQASTLFATDTINDVFFSVDTVTGESTEIGVLGQPSQFTPAGLAYDPNTNTFYGADNFDNQLFSVDGTTGQATVIGSLGDAGGGITSLAFDPNTNTLYGNDAFVGNSPLLSIDVKTGETTAIGSGLGTPSNQNLVGLAFDTNTNALYGIRSGFFAGGDFILIDTAAGTSSVVAEGIVASTTGGFSSLAFDAITDSFYTAGPGPNASFTENFLFSITRDGVVSQIGTGLGFNSVAGLTALAEPTMAPIPVPGALILMAGPLGFAFARKAKRTANGR